MPPTAGSGEATGRSRTGAARDVRRSGEGRRTDQRDPNRPGLGDPTQGQVSAVGGGVLLLGLSTDAWGLRERVSIPAEADSCHPGAAVTCERGHFRPGQTHQVRWREFDLQTAPAGRNEHRLEVESSRVDDDREGRREPNGLIPPTTKPVARSASAGSAMTARRPPKRIGKTLQVELVVDRDHGQDESSIDASRRASCGPAPGRRRGPPRRPRRTRGVGRGRARGVLAARRRGPGGRPRPGRSGRARASRTWPRPDATDFGYAPGGSVRPSASIDARRSSHRRAPDRCPRRAHDLRSELDLRFTRPVGRPRAHGRRGGV